MSFYTDAVQRYLKNNDLADVSVGGAAASLRCSVTTMRRLLQSEGSVYSDMLEAERKRRCLESLESNPRAYTYQIAEAAGFTEPNSLTRAFRGWFGLSIREVRANPALLMAHSKNN